MKYEEIIEELVEKCAELEHDRWAKWQAYLHSKCFPHTINSFNATTKQYEDIPTGGIVIPRELRNRWERQIGTSYSELSEEEKESDRIQVREYLPLLTSALTKRDEAIRKIIEEILDGAEKYGDSPSDIVKNFRTLLAKLSEE